MLSHLQAAVFRPPHGHHLSKTHLELIQMRRSKKSPPPEEMRSSESADDGDDDDDDEDDDDASEEAIVMKAPEGANISYTPTSHFQHYELQAAKQTKATAESELQSFKDDEAFDEKIAAEVTVIANETDAPALSSFLGNVRREIRMFAKPSYTQYLEKKVETAEKRVRDLEKELAADEGKDTVSSEKKDAIKPVAKTPKEAAPSKEAPKEAAPKDPKGAASSEAAEVEQKAGETWAISFFANIALLAIVFAMASATNEVVKNYTWFIIDQVIVVFLAVMYFQAFDSLLDFGKLRNPVLASVLHAVLMLAMVLILAYSLRRSSLGLAIFCAVGGKVVTFSSVHAATAVQVAFVGSSYTWSMCIFGLLVLIAGFGIVGYLVYTAKKREGELDSDGITINHAFMDKTNDLETKSGAMAFSVCFTMFVRFVLTGHHPVDAKTEFDHTSSQRTRMFLYACFCLLVAGVAVKQCSKKAASTDSFAVKRLMVFLNTVAAMNVAWAFLLWGEWEFYEHSFPGEAVKGRVMFAILASFIGGLMLIGLTKLPTLAGKAGTAAESDKMVALTAISLVIAWSWGACFNQAVEDMVEGVSHPAGWKIAATVALFAVVVPVYAYYVKPITGPAAEAITAHH